MITSMSGGECRIDDGLNKTFKVNHSLGIHSRGKRTPIASKFSKLVDW